MKRKLLVSIFAVALALTGVFGFASVKSVQAAESTIAGFELIGAGLRLETDGDDSSGLRFETTVSQDALAEIFTEADGQKVIFGTEITDADNSGSIMDFSYINVSSITSLPGYDANANEPYSYFATITFNEAEFADDVKDLLIEKGTLDENAEDFEVQLANYVTAYKAASYAELLTAKSYYKIGDGEAVYTDTLTRSISMLANYYDKGGFLEGDNLTNFNTLINKKKYFTDAETNATLEGYLYFDEETATIEVEGFTATNKTRISYNQENLTFNYTDSSLNTLEINALLGEGNELTAENNITLYAFNENNEVTTLNLKVAKVISAYLSYDKDNGVEHFEWEDNGEIVGTGLKGEDVPDTSNYRYMLGETEVTGSISGDKILLKETTLETLTLPELCETVEVEVINANNDICYVLNCKYVTLAIDEASDLSKFNVGYTFDQTEYETKVSTYGETSTEVTNYLVDCEANPYDYYDGYYVLTNNVDASEIPFTHEAVITLGRGGNTRTVTNVGFDIDETNDVITPANLDANGAVFTGSSDWTVRGYNIPRAHYPAIKDTSKVPQKLLPGAFFYKMGLLGTFDGQGYTITNFLDVARDTTDLYVYRNAGEEGAADEEVNVDKYEAGLFGVTNAGSVIQNVGVIISATDRENVTTFSLIDVSNTSGTDGDKILFTGPTDDTTYLGSNRTQFNNIYIEVNGTGITSIGVLTAFTAGNRHSEFTNVFVNAPYITNKRGNLNNPLNTLLGGGHHTYSNAAASPDNSGLIRKRAAVATNVYVFGSATTTDWDTQIEKITTSEKMRDTLDVVCVYADSGANDISNLYASTTSLQTDEPVATMAERFADVPYWNIADDGAVTWASLPIA